MREEADPAYQEGRLEVYDDLESAIQQIRMTLFTKKGEVLGEPNFGLDVEKYLFSYNIDPFVLSKEADQQINSYVSEARKRAFKISPASYNDTKSERQIFVLNIEVPEIKTPLSIFFD